MGAEATEAAPEGLPVAVVTPEAAGIETLNEMVPAVGTT